MKTTTPKYFSGWNWTISQMFGMGPKLTITCGECSLSFTKRITMITNPGVECQYCGTTNIIPIEVD